VNSFEGGAITTNDDALAERMRRMKNFGFVGYDAVEYLGTNGKMPEVSAAMGLTSLDAMQEFIDANRRHAQRYHDRLHDLPGITMMRHDGEERLNFQYVVLELNGAEGRIRRDQLIELLWTENVLARRYFYPGCHRMEPYRTLQPHVGRRLPHTERLADRVVVLPNGSTMTDSDVDAVCAVIRLAVQHAPEIDARLETRGSSPSGRGPASGS
jgi:dTDP-4-amino-4,6-dideoxygalactose transaminase